MPQERDRSEAKSSKHQLNTAQIALDINPHYRFNVEIFSNCTIVQF